MFITYPPSLLFWHGNRLVSRGEVRIKSLSSLGSLLSLGLGLGTAAVAAYIFVHSLVHSNVFIK